MKVLFHVSIFVLISVLIFPLPGDAKSLCERMHSCPSKDGSFVCGDTGRCSKCPDNPFCQGGKSIKQLDPKPAPPAVKSKKKVKEKVGDFTSGKKPFETIPVDEKPSNTYPFSAQLCMEKGKLDYELRGQDLSQTQDTFFCKKGTRALPEEDWVCDGGSVPCSGKPEKVKLYSCHRNYICIAENPDYNRGMFKKELAEYKKRADEKSQREIQEFLDRPRK